MLSPLGPEDSPGLELNYGSADNPQTIWFELPQVGGLCALRRWQKRLTQAWCAREPGPRPPPTAPAWWGWGQRQGAGWGALASRACARTGPGAEAHHHLPAGPQLSFHLVAGLHPRGVGEGQRRGQEASLAKSHPDSLLWVLSGQSGLDFTAWFWNLPQHSPAGPRGGAAIATPAGSHETPSGVGLGLSLGWALQELGLGVRCCPVWGRCPPGPWPDTSMSPALGAAAAEEIKLLREQGCVHENQQDFIPLVTAEAPPGLPGQGLRGSRAWLLPVCPRALHLGRAGGWHREGRRWWGRTWDQPKLFLSRPQGLRLVGLAPG